MALFTNVLKVRELRSRINGMLIQSEVETTGFCHDRIKVVFHESGFFKNADMFSLIGKIVQYEFVNNTLATEDIKADAFFCVDMILKSIDLIGDNYVMNLEQK